MNSSRFKNFCSGLAATVCFLMLSTAAQAASTLYDIRYNPVGGGETRIDFVFDQTQTLLPKITPSSTPAKLEITFANSLVEQQLHQLDVNIDGIESIESREYQSDTIVNVHLKNLKMFQTSISANVISVLLTDNLVKRDMNLAQPGKGLMNKVNAIDFRTGDLESKQGNLVVFLDNNMAAVDVVEKGGKIHIEFHNTDILEDLLYTLDVNDFGTVVTEIETFSEGNNSRIEITTSHAFSFDYQQVDNIFTLSVERQVEGEGLFSDNMDYNGTPISLNFQDIPVRTVLQIIADYNNFNLVTSDTVDGNVTLRLDGVPWDQALDIILRVKGLDKRMQGNILMVAPTEEFNAREARELESEQQMSDLAPVYSEFLSINYAKAGEIAALLKSEGTGMLSTRGSVSVDDRTNTLLVKDTRQSLDDVKRMIKVLDIPVKQVVIESRMVTVRDNITEELGVRWGFTKNDGDDGTSGTLEGAEDAAQGIVPSIDDRLNVNLPVINPAGSIGFHVARLADGTIIDLELSALERENKGEIIASPRITTANQQEAYIEQGTEIPYVESSSSGATSVTFKKAILGLRVTPHITPDNRIILDLVVTQDTRGDTVSTSTGPAVAIDTQEIGTQVLVDNGETIVLGGIYQQQIINAVTKVPILGDIPYLGWLFRQTSEFNEKKELLIFVTPRIVTEEL